MAWPVAYLQPAWKDSGSWPKKSLAVLLVFSASAYFNLWVSPSNAAVSGPFHVLSG